MDAISEFPPIGTTFEVAKLIRCSPGQVREWHYQGKLRGFIAGRSLRFTREALAAFIAERESRP